jgi:hypothetical protein
MSFSLQGDRINQRLSVSNIHARSWLVSDSPARQSFPLLRSNVSEFLTGATADLKRSLHLVAQTVRLKRNEQN